MYNFGVYMINISLCCIMNNIFICNNYYNENFFFIVFVGKKCLFQFGSLIRIMFDLFEGGIFLFYWELVLGGGIGFGCGVLCLFVYGKILYFNGCGYCEV